MNIVINGEKRDIKDQITLRQLIDDLGLNYKAVAVERNKNVCVKSDFDTIVIEPDDTLEIVQFVGGG